MSLTQRSSLLITSLLVAVLALSSCSQGVGGARNGYISGDGQTIRVDPQDRGEPIELAGAGLDGKPLDVASYRGKPLVINIWGSWCGPCRSEMPLLVDIVGELGQDAPMIGINIRDENAAAQAFMRNKSGTWPSIESRDGKALQPFMDSGLVNPKNIPTTLVLDAKGRVAAAVQGEITRPGTFIKTVRQIAAGD